MTLLYTIAIIFLIVANVQTYALDGTWVLRTSEIPQLKKIAGGILFTFEQSLNSDGQIENRLTIYSCNKLIYNYNARDDQIFFKHIQTGSFVRPCVTDEIIFIRNQIDIIFNFYIMNTVMLMLPPNGVSPIKFDRYVTTTLAQINGVWNIEDSVFYSKITDPKVTVNGSHIAFCGGNSVFSYRLSTNNGISIKSVSNGSSCNSLATSKLTNASLYRVKQGEQLYIYDGNVSMIMHLSKKQNYAVVKTIEVRQVNNSKNVKSTNSSQNVQNITSNSNTKNTTNSSNNQTNTKSNNTINKPNQTNASNNNANLSPSSASSNSTNKNATITPNSSKTITITNTTNNRTNIDTKASIPASNKNATSENKTNSSSSTSNSSASTASASSTKSTPPAATSLNMVVIQSANQAFGIWYPYNISQIPSLASYPANALSKYQIIINPARILISGGCNTIFSSYSFVQNKFTKFSQVSTQNKCPTNYDSVIADILYGNNQFYTIGSSPPILAIKSANGTLLLLLSQTAPQ